MPAPPNDATSSSERLDDPQRRHRVVQHLLVTVAVLSAVATALGLLLVQRVGTTYRDGLEVTADGADVAALGASSAQQLADDLVRLADAASSSIDEARGFVETAAESTQDLGDAFATNIADGVSGTASIAADLAGFIEAVERFIPGDRDSLAEDLRLLSDSLEPVPGQLRSLGEQLRTSSVSLDAAAVSLAGIVAQLDQVEASIDEARSVLTEVETLSVDVAERAERSLERSGTDLWLVRLLVLVLGLGFAGAAIAAHRAVGLFIAADELDRDGGAGGGTRTHTPRGTGT